MHSKFGVFGLNQFQLLWDSEEDALAEAKRLALKHKKDFSVMQKNITVNHEGKIIDGNS